MNPNSDKSAEAHWADRVAGEIAAQELDGQPPVISTGISPSGEIHIGNMREVLTGDAIHRALGDRGLAPRFNFIADNFDPLRRVYPFLDQETYAPLVGRPISQIPCPCGTHESYAEHFLQPFLEALRQLRVDVEVERSDQMYRSGRMRPFVVAALEQRDRIAEILRELTGKEVAEDWSPFNPLCASCGRITSARVIGFSTSDYSVDYACECGARGTLPMDGGGKLVWRIDWPARWRMLGVTVEPFGKDHATRGGSYDTGERIIREAFGGRPPYPIPYEWIRLKGRGDMSSSKGNVLSIGQILEVAPPEALRYLVIRERPQKTINFDPGIPLLQLVDEVDDAHTRGRNERAVELSRAGEFQPVGVSYKHLVVVAQVAEFDVAKAVGILRRTGHAGVSTAAVASRMDYARRWLDTFAPDDIKFTVQHRLPEQAGQLGQEQRRFLAALAEELRAGMDGEAVHRVIWELAAKHDSLKPAKLFEAIYVSILGKTRGPRAGWFIALLGADTCAARFREASGGMS
jgi:lysyl-tRNA synthetase class 1